MVVGGLFLVHLVLMVVFGPSWGVGQEKTLMEWRRYLTNNAHACVFEISMMSP